MKTQTITLALVAIALSSGGALGMPAMDGPAPTLAARQNFNSNDGVAVVDDTTLSTGLNNIGGQTYTYTDGYVIGPTITQGPNLQLNPSVTQAFGCQIVAGGTQQGDCDNIQAKISSALASVTGGSQNTAAPATSSSSSSSAQQTSVGGSSSGNSNTNNGGSTSTSQSSSSPDAATSLHVSGWTLTCAVLVGSVLAMFR